jgi:hypothetical protein
MRLDSIPIELFLGFYDFIEEDLLKVIELSHSTGQTLATFNSTFMSFSFNS